MSEVQVTQGDWDAAQAAFDGWNAAYAAHGERIALAIAQAREEGYKAAYAELTKSDTPIDVSPLRWVNGKRCAPEGYILDDNGVIREEAPYRRLIAAAMECNGIVDCTNVDVAGMVVRKVNGKLPIAGDNVVIGEGAEVFTRTGLRAECDIHITGPVTYILDTGTHEVVSYDPSEVYSSQQAAESAREVASDK